MTDLAYRTPEDLAEATGDFEAIRHPETPYGRECRLRDAIQEVRDRFYRDWMKLSSECHDEIERLKRELR